MHCFFKQQEKSKADNMSNICCSEVSHVHFDEQCRLCNTVVTLFSLCLLKHSLFRKRLKGAGAIFYLCSWPAGRALSCQNGNGACLNRGNMILSLGSLLCKKAQNRSDRNQKGQRIEETLKSLNGHCNLQLHFYSDTQKEKVANTQL